MAARYWTGGIRFEMGAVLTGITMEDGAVRPAVPDEGQGVIVITGPEHLWEKVRAATPPRFFNDINIATGAFEIFRNGHSGQREGRRGSGIV